MIYRFESNVKISMTKSRRMIVLLKYKGSLLLNPRENLFIMVILLSKINDKQDIQQFLHVCCYAFCNIPDGSTIKLQYVTKESNLLNLLTNDNISTMLRSTKDCTFIIKFCITIIEKSNYISLLSIKLLPLKLQQLIQPFDKWVYFNYVI